MKKKHQNDPGQPNEIKRLFTLAKCRQPRYTREKSHSGFCGHLIMPKAFREKHAPSHFPSFSLHAWHLGPTTTSHCAGQNGHSLHLLLALVKLPPKKDSSMRKSMVFFKLKSSDLKSKSGFVKEVLWEMFQIYMFTIVRPFQKMPLQA